MASTPDIRAWLPGAQSSKDTFASPKSIPPGTYALDVAILDEAGKSPRVHLANLGERSDGWTELSKVVVK